jgi:hypothetical protein
MNNEQGAIIGHCILNSGNKEMLVDGIANLQFGKKAQLNVERPNFQCPRVRRSGNVESNGTLA